MMVVISLNIEKLRLRKWRQLFNGSRTLMTLIERINFDVFFEPRIHEDTKVHKVFP